MRLCGLHTVETCAVSPHGGDLCRCAGAVSTFHTVRRCGLHMVETCAERLAHQSPHGAPVRCARSASLQSPHSLSPRWRAEPGRVQPTRVNPGMRRRQTAARQVAPGSDTPCGCVEAAWRLRGGCVEAAWRLRFSVPGALADGCHPRQPRRRATRDDERRERLPTLSPAARRP